MIINTSCSWMVVVVVWLLMNRIVNLIRYREEISSAGRRSIGISKNVNFVYVACHFHGQINDEKYLFAASLKKTIETTTCWLVS